MKTLILQIMRKMIIAIILCLGVLNIGFSQPGPPDPGGQPSGPPLPHNSAPVGGGSGVLILLSVIYAAGKVYFINRKQIFPE